MLTDSRGNTKETYSYDAFGNQYGDNSFGSSYGNGWTTGVVNEYGYNGKRFNSAVGLADYGFRDYMPLLGRFTTVDPIKSGLNWYAYVGNDPVNKIDLWGLLESDRDSAWDYVGYTDTIPASERIDEYYSYEYIDSELRVIVDPNKVNVSGTVGEVIRSEFVEGDVDSEYISGHSNPEISVTDINIDATVTMLKPDGTTDTISGSGDLDSSGSDWFASVEVSPGDSVIISVDAEITYTFEDGEEIIHTLGVQ